MSHPGQSSDRDTEAQGGVGLEAQGGAGLGVDQRGHGHTSCPHQAPGPLRGCCSCRGCHTHFRGLCASCTHSCLHIGSTDPAYPPATRHACCFMGSSSSSTHHPSRPGPCGLAAAGQGCCLQRGDRQSVARGQGLGGLRRPCSPGGGWSGERQLGVWGDRGLTSSRDHPPWIPHIKGAQESPRHPPCRSPASSSASKPLLRAYRCPLRAAPGASTGQCARGRVPVGSSALGPNTDGDVTSGRSLVLSEPIWSMGFWL